MSKRGRTSRHGAAPRALLRPAILVLLSEHDDHGYALLERLVDVGLGGVDSGGMYRALRALEDEGTVRSWWASSERGSRRRVYALTFAGQDDVRQSLLALADQRDTVTQLVERAQRSGVGECHDRAGEERLIRLA
jgi:PadR family transcriptional regulator PadR